MSGVKGILPGQISTNPQELGLRDAFHIPAIQVKSKFFLNPGEPVSFIDKESVIPCDLQNRQGVVDIFLHNPVKPGKQFWVFLVPGIVTGITHTFHAEGVPGDDDTSAAKIASLVNQISKLESENKNIVRKLQNAEDELNNDECRGCW